jgi:hypothetical protein
VPQSSRDIEEVAGIDDAFPGMFYRRITGFPRDGRIQPPDFFPGHLSYEDIMFISMDMEAMDISPCNVHVNSGRRAKESFKRLGKHRERRMHFVYVAQDQCCAFPELIGEFFNVDPRDHPALARAVFSVRTRINRGSRLYQFELIGPQSVQL